MTAVEFPDPAFSSDQWEQIKTFATFMKPGYAHWISDYFARLRHALRQQVADEDHAPLPLADETASQRGST